MAGKTAKRWPGQSDTAYPEVFTAIPASALECAKNPKPGQFTEQQLRQYFEQGYVQVDDFFTPDELEPVKRATEERVEFLAQRLHKAGKISDLHQDAGLFKRLSLVEKDFPGSTILMHKVGVPSQAYRDLWTNGRLMNLMEQLLDTKDIQGHPVWNLRPKTPINTSATVPWHQDSAYLDNDSYGVHQVTAWIPLLDTNADNGCLEMVKRGHVTGKIANHTCCWKDTWYTMLAEDEMEKTLGVDMKRDSVICPVPYGGALFFANTIPHRSLPNTSDAIRWSLDLRWQRMDQPVGFYGLKNGIQFSSSTDANFKVDWSAFDAENVHKKRPEDATDQLTPIIVGPWMRKWEMVNTNQHTAALEQQEAATATTGSTLLGWHA